MRVYRSLKTDIWSQIVHYHHPKCAFIKKYLLIQLDSEMGRQRKADSALSRMNLFPGQGWGFGGWWGIHSHGPLITSTNPAHDWSKTFSCLWATRFYFCHKNINADITANKNASILLNENTKKELKITKSFNELFQPVLHNWCNKCHCIYCLRDGAYKRFLAANQKKVSMKWWQQISSFVTWVVLNKWSHSEHIVAHACHGHRYRPLLVSVWVWINDAIWQ